MSEATNMSDEESVVHITRKRRRSIESCQSISSSESSTDSSSSSSSEGVKSAKSSAGDSCPQLSEPEEEPEEEILQLVEELRGPPDGAETKISNSKLRRIVSAMSAWWTALPVPGKSFLQHASTRWGKCQDGRNVAEKMKAGNLTSVDLRFVYDREMFKRVRIDAMLRQRGLLESAGKHETGLEDVAGVGYAEDISKIQDCIARSYHLLNADIQYRKALDPTVDHGAPTLVDPFGYVPYTQGKLNEFQSFLVYLLRQLHDSGYRRYNGSVYEQIKSPTVFGYDGKQGKYATHAWNRVSDISAFVIDRTKKEDCFVQWQSMTNGNARERASQYLASCIDPEFAELKPNRLWHSFHNGMYFVDKQEFYRYGDPRIPPDIVACKFHDQEFDESVLEEPWEDLKVKHVQDVLEYQFYVDEHDKNGIYNEEQQQRVVNWVYALLGRLLYEVGAKDKWQVIPFIVGRAGTGKSLLLKSVAFFFNPEDVETVANNCQKDFGLETLVNKFIWMCYEVKHDFKMDQAALQCMASGDGMSIMRKNKTAVSLVWTVPGILAGNETANWVDNSGSMSRRVVMVQFQRKVKEVDGHLDSKIKNNIGAFLHKCASAYASKCASFGGKDLWQEHHGEPILPKYFHARREKLQVDTDFLMSFLKDSVAIKLTDQKHVSFHSVLHYYTFTCTYTHLHALTRTYTHLHALTFTHMNLRAGYAI